MQQRATWRVGFAAAALLCLLAQVSVGEPLVGKVVGVIQGDTVRLRSDGDTVEVRLRGIDCPEPAQPCGEDAARFVSRLLLNKQTTVTPFGKDTAGRIVGDIHRATGETLNATLVRLGYAWYDGRSGEIKALASLEEEARAAGKRLWAEPSPTPPWEYRAQHGETEPEPAVEAPTICPQGTKLGSVSLDQKKTGVPVLRMIGDGQYTAPTWAPKPKKPRAGGGQSSLTVLPDKRNTSGVTMVYSPAPTRMATPSVPSSAASAPRTASRPAGARPST